MPPATESPASPADQPSAGSVRPDSTAGGVAAAPGPVVVAVLTLVIKLLLAMPDRLLSLLFGKPPAVAEGLRPDNWAMARVTEVIREDPYDQTPAQAREALAILGDAVISPENPQVVTEDIPIELDGRTIRSRLYRPAGAPERAPLLVYFHGGGFVVGSIETHDHGCRILASRSDVMILSVEYRKAPEDPFPAAVDDALDAWQWVVADPERLGADPGRIGVAGDSAGGNIAAVLCQDLKRLGEDQPAFQMLLYPVTVIGGRGGSFDDFAEGFFLTRRGMDWYSENYLGEQDGNQSRVAPLVEEDLSGLAPAYVSTALADPLRDEGEIYATRLYQAGVPVRLDRMPMIHGWFNITGSRSTQAGLDVLAEVLASQLVAPGD